MSNLATNDKQILEKLLQMSSGYVLNFTDRHFQEFFKDDVGINIFDPKYEYASGSKANRMRRFWQVADNATVGKSIERLIAYIEAQIFLGHLSKSEFPDELVHRARSVAARLSGITTAPVLSEDEFIAKEFRSISIDKLGLDVAITGLLKKRLDEIKQCLTAKAALATIFLCGSSLEGILLGVACNRTKEFNQSAKSPKDKFGKVRQFQDWTLNDFINVARDLNLVGEDVKKFSHAMRDFRNYIHPYQQMSSGFDPDEHTARICWQVLQTAIAQLSK